LRQPAVQRANRSQSARDRSLAQSFFVKMRKKPANRDVIDVPPVAGTNVSRKIVEIAGIGFDGVWRSIALAQGTQELIRGFFDESAGLFHSSHLAVAADAALAFARGWCF